MTSDSEKLARLLALRVTITDTAALKEITPRQVIAYAKKRGWGLTPIEGDIWTFATVPAADPDDCDIAIPMRQAAPDYYRRMAECLAALCAFENRPQNAVYLELIEMEAECG